MNGPPILPRTFAAAKAGDPVARALVTTPGGLARAEAVERDLSRWTARAADAEAAKRRRELLGI